MSSQASYFTHTETETDDQDLAAAIAKQKEQLEKTKKKGTDAGRSSTMKRIMAGFFVLSYFLISVLIGFHGMFVLTILFNIAIFNELSHIGRDPKKQRAISLSLEWTIYFTCVYIYLPKYALTKAQLTYSGFTKE